MERAIVEPGDLTDSVATQGSNRTRSLVWEDDAPAESRFRRVQQSAPAPVRGLPLDFDDDPSEPRKGRFAAPRAPWWRPEGPWGRVFLLSALLVATCAVAYIVHSCKMFLEHDARFRINSTSDIESTGLAEVTRGEMLPVFGEDIGRNIFFVPLAERRRQLEQIPWIQQATVMRLLPDQIHVAIVERQPVAFVRHGQQIGLVDIKGVLLNMPPALLAKHHYSFPVLTGIDAADPLPSRKARIDLYERMMADLDANGQHNSEQLSEIDLTDPEDARVLMPEQGADILAHFGEDHFLDRYRRYKAHIAEWRQQYPSLAAVDLRYDQQVVLQMAPGAATEQTALAAESSKPIETAKPLAGQPVLRAAEPKAVRSAPARVVGSKSVEPKPVSSRTAPSKTAPLTVARNVKPAKPHPSRTATASAREVSPKTRQQRVNDLAARMRAQRATEAKRAALKRNKQKSTTKSRSAASAVQGQ